MKARWTFHPILLAVYPIVALYGHNAAHTSVRELVGPVGIALAAVALVWAVAALLLRHAVRAGHAAPWPSTSL